MNSTEVANVVVSLDNMEIDDKIKVYDKIFSLGNLASDDLNDKLMLISLLSLLYRKMKQKDTQITPLKILMSITGQGKDKSGFYQFLESLAIMTTDLSYGCNKFDPCGCKTPQEIVNKIKEITNTWLPF